MDLARLIRDLASPEAYPHEAEGLEVRQTHISVVFLAGRYAYKIKKPVDLGFLDFTSRERRLHFCEEEVRLNRRLAPDIYLGVVPVVESDGRLLVDGEGAPVEHAVKMKRLPDRATLLESLERGELAEDVFEELGPRIAAFHAEAESGPDIDRYGRYDVVAGNARENLEQCRGHVGECLSEAVHARLDAGLERRLDELRPLIEARAQAHVPRDTHGDLHLDHVYLFPERAPPRDLIIIDCIEFNERFRYADPIADMAFLAMDLIAHGRRDLAERFADAYFQAANDREGRGLLSFYVSYRAAVRAKVAGMLAEEGEVPLDERRRAVERARTHWLLALSEIAPPDVRPGLVLIGGLPGTGKTTLAEDLAAAAGLEVISSDRVRKELAGMCPEAPAAAPFASGIYTPEWNDRTYAACLDRARDLVFEGRRVIVDASFRERAERAAFLRVGLDWGVRCSGLLCTAPPETVRARLDARRGGASDADWSIYESVAEAWEVDDAGAQGPGFLEVSTDGGRAEALDAALVRLRAAGLAADDDGPYL